MSYECLTFAIAARSCFPSVWQRLPQQKKKIWSTLLFFAHLSHSRDVLKELTCSSQSCCVTLFARSSCRRLSCAPPLPPSPPTRQVVRTVSIRSCDGILECVPKVSLGDAISLGLAVESWAARTARQPVSRTAFGREAPSVFR